MKKYVLEMDPAAARFYETLARRKNTSPEKIMSATLFRLAGEISLEAVLENQNPKS